MGNHGDFQLRVRAFGSFVSVNTFNEGNELKSKKDELINPKIHWSFSITCLA